MSTHPAFPPESNGSVPSEDLSSLTITLRGRELPVADALNQGLLSRNPATGRFEMGHAYSNLRPKA